jgi:hypothetical protein
MTPSNSSGQVEQKKGGGRNPDQRKGQSENEGRGKGGSGLGNYTQPPPANNVPEHVFNIVLGRPNDRGVTIRVLLHQAVKAYVIYGREPGKLSERSTSFQFKAKEVHDFVLNELLPNSRYHYKLVYQTESGVEQSSDEYSFHTQRDVGSSFVFTVTADSHLDENTSGEVYLRTLANASLDAPDFHFELGDTFMTGKYVKPELAEPQYLAQRYYLGSLCHSVPLFFVMGNHDGESGSRGKIDQTPFFKQLKRFTWSVRNNPTHLLSIFFHLLGIAVRRVAIGTAFQLRPNFVDKSRYDMILSGMSYQSFVEFEVIEFG